MKTLTYRATPFSPCVGRPVSLAYSLAANVSSIALSLSLSLSMNEIICAVGLCIRDRPERRIDCEVSLSIKPRFQKRRMRLEPSVFSCLFQISRLSFVAYREEMRTFARIRVRQNGMRRDSRLAARPVRAKLIEAREISEKMEFALTGGRSGGASPLYPRVNSVPFLA